MHSKDFLCVVNLLDSILSFYGFSSQRAKLASTGKLHWKSRVRITFPWLASFGWSE